MKFLVAIIALCIFAGAFSQVPYPNVYNESDAEEFAMLAGVVYCLEQYWSTLDCEYKCNDIKSLGYTYEYGATVPIAIQEDLVLAIYTNTQTKRAVISFRGTGTYLQLFIESLYSVKPVEYTLHNIPNAWINNYFQSKYEEYLRPLVTLQLAILTQKYPDYLFVFTGHSLGAALSTIACHDQILLGNSPKAQTILYNFGSPRVGNYPYAQSVVDTIPVIFRVVRYKDIVTHLPPCETNILIRCVPGPYGPADWDYEEEYFNEDEKNKLTVQQQGDSDLEWNPYWHPWHIWPEVFYTKGGLNSPWVQCNTGEDPKCSDRYGMLAVNVQDHLGYVDIVMGRCFAKNPPYPMSDVNEKITVKIE